MPMSRPALALTGLAFVIVAGVVLRQLLLAPPVFSPGSGAGGTVRSGRLIGNLAARCVNVAASGRAGLAAHPRQRRLKWNGYERPRWLR